MAGLNVGTFFREDVEVGFWLDGALAVFELDTIIISRAQVDMGKP